MRYFDQTLIANSRHHAQWWGEVGQVRDSWMDREEQLTNQAAFLPRDAWLDLDTQTRTIMRHDEGAVFMSDLMPLAKTVDIGKLVHMYRVSSDISDEVIRSMGGQVPTPVDKTRYDFRGAPVPIFSKGYGREWREERTLRTEGFDALADDDAAATAKVRENMADYALDGDPSIVVEGYAAYGLRNSPFTKVINLGTGAGGASIDLTTSNSDATESFINGPFGKMLDDNRITSPVNLYISPEIARNWDKPYSGSAGNKIGSLREAILANRRIAKIEVTWKLTGNQFFGFVPRAEFIRPLIAMAVATTPKNRINIHDNFQFVVMGAMGIEVRADINGRTGVFASTVVN